MPAHRQVPLHPMTRASQRSSQLASSLLLVLLALHSPASELDDLVKRANGAQGKVKRYLDDLRERASDPGTMTEADWQALREAETSIETPPFRRLLAGGNTLQYEVENFRANAFEAYATKGDEAHALDTLQAMGQAMLVPHLNLLIQERFPTSQANPALQRIMAQNTVAARMGKQSALGTAYQPALSDAEKAAGLSLYWSQARSYFVHFDHVADLDWDAAYLSFLPKVQAAKTTKDYYRVLMQFAALLHDGHSNVYPPAQLEADFYSRPPMRTALIEGKVVVTSVQSPSLQQRIAVGDEIVAIDGQPAQQYARQNIEPYVSSSTPQDLQARLYGSQLLAGAEGKPLKLTLAKAGGKASQLTVARSGYTDVVPRKFFDFHILPGNIAYLSLDHFETDQGLRLFREHLPEIQQARGLILDVRRNGGGNTGIGLNILAHLTDKPIPNGAYSVRADSGLDHTRFDWLRMRPDSTGEFFKPEPVEQYTGPVMVLAGAQTFSAAEDFLMAFDVIARGKIIGEPSGGSTGQPLLFSLPGGGLGRICVKRDAYPDGKPFVGIGIQPQIVVAPTVADIREGRDPVLERAKTEIEQIAAH